jgi:ribosomal protein L29
LAKKSNVGDLRQLTDKELTLRERKLAEMIPMRKFNWYVSSSSINASSIRSLKTERARILTIQRERQLSLRGLESSLLKDAKRIIDPGIRRASRMQRAPIVTAKLLGSEYPMVVGRPYTFVLQRHPEGIQEIQGDLFRDTHAPSKATKVRKRAFSGNVDLDVIFHAKHLLIDPSSPIHQMKQRSNLSIEITPQEPGDTRMDIYLTMPTSKQVLQVLQVPLAVITNRGLQHE